MDEMCHELGAKATAPPALKQATAPPAPVLARVATPAPAPATARARAPAQVARSVALVEGPEVVSPPPTGHPVPADASAAATIARLEERSSQQALSIARLGAELAAATIGGWHNVYLAPLKLAHIDSEGTMRLKYWTGNDAMLGAPVPVRLTNDDAVAEITKNISTPCNNANGTVIVGAAPAGNGSVIFFGAGGDPESIEMGVVGGVLCVWTRASSAAPRVILEEIDRAMTLGATVHWRVLLRGSMAEVYVDDVLIIGEPRYGLLCCEMLTPILSLNIRGCTT